ncbi:Glycosyltransferase, GT2 family [Austwickia chelonae]|uniref:Putative glycosyltransferase n=1 Tax=Austwickia chelonae NBRC 105200 TaxID=1184607 RepID=K6V9Y4_9MICO|nr:glycosyltransferase [Austwickia chelonae]GAB79023.1 putative glycosyltransferase [Austwickia chelonae NBRC 105200]SEW41698.1 Glycosyltransferase, GT2 family [Austwickia chelonae]
MSENKTAGGVPSGRGIRVAVAVPTYRRNDHLTALLPLLVEQIRDLDEGVTGRVVIVDNDPGQGARPVVEEAALPGVTYVSETTPGIASARNQALAACADDDALVFIDDDERPHPLWLALMVRTWLSSGAAGVAGRVLADYPEDLDPWVLAGGFFVRRTWPTGTVVPAAPTSNLLVDLAVVRRMGLLFDVRTGMTGGEDTLFTRTLTAAGERIVYCEEAAVVDQVPGSRANRRWVLTRAFSHGNSTGLLDTGFPGGSVSSLRRVQVGAGGVARGAVGAARACAGVVLGRADHQAKGLRLAARGLGIAVGASGRVFLEYARPLPDGSVRRVVPVSVLEGSSSAGSGQVGGPA